MAINETRATIEIDADISAVEKRLAELEARFKTTTEKLTKMLGTAEETSGSKKFGSFFDLSRKAEQLTKTIADLKGQLADLNKEMEAAGGDRQAIKVAKLTAEYEKLAAQLIKTTEAASGGDEKAAGRLEKVEAKTKEAYDRMVAAKEEASKKELAIEEKTADKEVAIDREAEDEKFALRVKAVQQDEVLARKVLAVYDKQQQAIIKKAHEGAEAERDAFARARVEIEKNYQKRQALYDKDQQSRIASLYKGAEKERDVWDKARYVAEQNYQKQQKAYDKNQQAQIASLLQSAQKQNEIINEASIRGQRAQDKAAEAAEKRNAKSLASQIAAQEKRRQNEISVAAAIEKEEDKVKNRIGQIQNEIVQLQRRASDQRLKDSLHLADEERKNNDRILANLKKTFAQTADESKKSAGGFAGALKGIWAEAGKLQNVLAGIGFQQFVRDSVDAALAMNRVETTFAAISGSAAQAQHSMDLVRDAALKLGAPIEESARGLAQMSAAAKESGLTSAQVEKVWRSLLETGRVLNLSNRQVELSIYAMIQMMSKGTVQSEELKRQLGDQIPGATQLAAKAMGVTTAEFDKMLKHGQIMSEDFLPKFAAQLHETFGPGLEKAAQSAAANMDRIKNSFFLMKAEVGTTLFAGADVLLPDALSKALEERGLSIGKLIGRAIASGLTPVGWAGAVAQNLKDLLPMWKKAGDAAAEEFVNAYIAEDTIGQIVDAQNQAGKELVDATQDLYKRAFHEGAKPIEEAIVALAEYEAAAQAAGGATAQQQGVIDASVKMIGNVYQALGPKVNPVLEEMAHRLGIVTDATNEAADATSSWSDKAEKDFQSKVYDSMKALTAASKVWLDHAANIDKATLTSERFKEGIKSLVDQWDKTKRDNPLAIALRELADQLGIVTDAEKEEEKAHDKAEKAADKEAKAQERLEKQHEKAAEKARKHAEAEAAAAARMLEAADAAKKEAEALVDNLGKALDDLKKTRDDLAEKTQGGVIGSLEDLDAYNKAVSDIAEKEFQLGTARQALANMQIGQLPQLKGLNDEFRALGINLDVARVPAEKLTELLRAMGEDEAAAAVAGGNLANSHEKVVEVLKTMQDVVPGAYSGFSGEAAQAAIGTITQLSSQVQQLSSDLEIATRTESPLPADYLEKQKPDVISKPIIQNNELLGKSADELNQIISDLPPVWARNAEQSELYDRAMKALHPTITEVGHDVLEMSDAIQGSGSALVDAAEAAQKAKKEVGGYNEDFKGFNDTFLQITDTAIRAGEQFDEVSGNIGHIVDRAEVFADTIPKVGRATQEQTEALNKQSEAVSGLASHQDEFNASLIDTSDTMDDATSSTKGMSKSADDLGVTLEDLNKRLDDVEQKIADSFGEKTLDGMRAIVEYMKSQMIPTAEALRDCLASTN